MVARKKTDVVQLSKIRMKESLRARLARDAERNGTTLNGEIVDRLEQSYAKEAEDLRDSAIIDMLVDHKRGNSDVLRTMASWLAKHPDWSHSKVNVKDMVERIFTAHGKEPNKEGPGDNE
jgi:hypothetical protein